MSELVLFRRASLAIATCRLYARRYPSAGEDVEELIIALSPPAGLRQHGSGAIRQDIHLL